MKKFELSDKEYESAEAFKKEHRACTEKLPCATDGKYPFTYSFTRGSIGSIVKIKCNGCGKEQNITDFDNW